MYLLISQAMCGYVQVKWWRAMVYIMHCMQYSWYSCIHSAQIIALFHIQCGSNWQCSCIYINLKLVWLIIESLISCIFIIAKMHPVSYSKFIIFMQHVHLCPVSWCVWWLLGTWMFPCWKMICFWFRRKYFTLSDTIKGPLIQVILKDTKNLFFRNNFPLCLQHSSFQLPSLPELISNSKRWLHLDASLLFLCMYEMFVDYLP